MSDLREASERAINVLIRCQTVLGNMALENTKGLAGIFDRWPISHEPLRADAQNLVPLIHEALEQYHSAAKAALSAQPQPEAEAVAWRYRYEMKDGVWGKWTVQKNKPLWYVAAQKDVQIEPLYTAPPLAPDARMRRALEKIAGSHWERVGHCQSDVDDVPDLTAEEAMREARRGLRADEGKESEGGLPPIDETLHTPEVIASLQQRAMAPSDPTPAEQREAIARLVEEQAHQIHAREHCHPPQEDNEADKWAMYRIRQELNTFVWHVLALSTRAGG